MLDTGKHPPSANGHRVIQVVIIADISTVDEDAVAQVWTADHIDLMASHYV
jgi:hypothetical protein